MAGAVPASKKVVGRSGNRVPSLITIRRKATAIGGSQKSTTASPIRFRPAAGSLRTDSSAVISTTGNSLHTRSTRSEEHTSELQSLMRNSYTVFCLKKNNNKLYLHKDTYTIKRY